MVRYFALRGAKGQLEDSGRWTRVSAAPQICNPNPRPL
jgi:hypothetical protein